MKENTEARSQIAETGNGHSHLPASKKIYVENNGLSIPFREISLSPSREMDGTLVENAPVRVYDTSGPWTDPQFKGSVTEGLPAHRRDWILARGDVEEYEGREVLPQDNGYLTKGAEELARVKDNGALEEFPGLKRKPLRAKPGHCVTQMHYARKGIITPEMEFVAIRENLGRQAGMLMERSSLIDVT
ncbi:hypothetical protein [Leptolyngbya sp. 7M]|uniref:hypothetical protein n=1 Tax=Leptolyngbya sp. 7M TaxID=2812896 RepID=UPI001B8C0E62|nr:hypothetical protein [Leptolyngbya sp. 7M]QYO65315.1 hypothetical protein JVX88_00585 [Leptolyngbya sp. 7M]